MSNTPKIDVAIIKACLEYHLWADTIKEKEKQAEVINTARQTIYQLILEVIELDPANRFNCEALRIQQRQKLSDLFNITQ